MHSRIEDVWSVHPVGKDAQLKEQDCTDTDERDLDLRELVSIELLRTKRDF